MRYAHAIKGDATWDTLECTAIIIDILTICSRAELKAEVIKELERLNHNLTKLADRNDVDQSTLKQTIERMHQTEVGLKDIKQPLAATLRDNAFINALKQRISIPGGTCNFDLPVLHLWLHQSHQARLDIINQWYAEFDLVREAIEMILDMIRNSGVATTETAEKGFYQKTLDPNAAYQLIRIGMPADSTLYPEVSAGKQRCTIYFRQFDLNNRPVQATENINFTLSTCVI